VRLTGPPSPPAPLPKGEGRLVAARGFVLTTSHWPLTTIFEMTKDELLQCDRTLVWHAFTQMAEYEPFIIERAEGCELIDLDGRRYIDGVSSLWCNLHGHRHGRIDAAVCEQLDKVAHVTNLGASNPTTIRLARRLVEIAPEGLNHVFFSDDGATAVEVALKMAFQYWRQCGGKGDSPHLCEAPSGPFRQMGTVPFSAGDGGDSKTCYLALGDAYHGDTIGSVSLGGVERFHAMFRPLLFETIRLPAPDSYRTPPGVSADNLCQYHLDLLEKVLAEHHRRIAAMVIEPLIQAAAGMVMHPPGYLRGVRELTRRYDVLLIADEVAVGFGRTGRMFACQHEDVSPDLLCLAKGLTGGYLPLAATLATDEIYNAFLGTYAESKSFFHGHTYGGNPLGAAAALASLEIFDEERTLEKLPEKCARLEEHLRRIAELPQVGDVRRRGLIAAVELVRDRATKEPYPWAERRGQRVCDFARTKGVWLRPLGNVVVIMPPLAISLEQIDRIMAAVAEGIARVQ
jgi:adenosylmethionine-8-amino-7-oxononanoate aminotransferase